MLSVKKTKLKFTAKAHTHLKQGGVAGNKVPSIFANVPKQTIHRAESSDSVSTSAGQSDRDSPQPAVVINDTKFHLVNTACPGEPPIYSTKRLNGLVMLHHNRRARVEKSVGGRKRDELLERLTVQCYFEGDPETILWACVSGCGQVYVNRNRARWCQHGALCSSLGPFERQLARDDLASLALGHQVDDQIPMVEAAVEDGYKESKYGAAEGKVEVKEIKTHPAMQLFIEKGKQDRNAAIDLAVINFLADGLPPPQHRPKANLASASQLTPPNLHPAKSLSNRG